MGFKYDWSQVEVVDLTDEDLVKGLAEFEAKYGMDSQTFYARYNRGELPEDDDFITWMFFFEANSKAHANGRSGG